MRNPWFLKGFIRPKAISIHESEPENVDDKNLDVEIEMVRSKSTPPFFNAFELISSMSSGFDLSSLFESKKKRSGSMFTTKSPAPAIMEKLENAAKKLNFSILWRKDYKLKIQGATEGRKGKLTVTAEVFEAAPEVAVVEFSKSGGDTLEYRKFCEEDIRPALKDIVWTWQGENNDGQRCED